MKALFQNTYQRLARIFCNGQLQPLPDQVSSREGFHYMIERFSVFQGRAYLSGWAWSELSEIKSISLVTNADERFAISSYGLPSEDIAKTQGKQSRQARFSEILDFTCESQDIIDASLLVQLENGEALTLKRFYESSLQADPALKLFLDFLRELKPETKGHLLEIGSRARSGVTRRQFTPSGWIYTGFDIRKGENVDVVGDAHQLSRYFPPQQYDAVMAFSVLEHLLMPWKFVIELNPIMKVGAVGYFLTHQCWPLHDEPWDFWRFSAEAWSALLNRKTGFEIISAKVGQPAFVVANVGHPAANYPEGSTGYLASCVVFRKIGATDLDWPVEASEIIDTQYPA